MTEATIRYVCRNTADTDSQLRPYVEKEVNLISRGSVRFVYRGFLVFTSIGFYVVRHDGPQIYFDVKAVSEVVPRRNGTLDIYLDSRD